MSHNMDNPNFLHCCLIGHSFITRLQRYMDSQMDLRNLNLDAERFHLEFRARGGLKIAHLARSAEMLRFESVPHVCFIQLGENDIAQGKVEQITRDITSLASYMHHGVGIKTVIVGQLFQRQPWASSADFNDKVRSININLKQCCDNEAGVVFWHHRGFWKDLSFLSHDGVHLDHMGLSSDHVVTSSPMHKFWRSVRSAILHYSAHLRSQSCHLRGVRGSRAPPQRNAAGNQQQGTPQTVQ